jgi:hypothetical protein
MLSIIMGEPEPLPEQLCRRVYVVEVQLREGPVHQVDVLQPRGLEGGLDVLGGRYVQVLVLPPGHLGHGDPSLAFPLAYRLWSLLKHPERTCRR